MTGFFELVLGTPPAGEPAARRDRGRPEDRRAVRPQRVQRRVRRPRRVPRHQRGAAHRHRRPHRVPRPQRQPGQPGVHAPVAPVGPRRRRARPVRGDAGDGRPGRRAGARGRVHVRLRPRPGRRAQPRQPLPRHRPGPRRRWRASGATGTGRSAPSTCRRRTRRSTSWPTAGCSTRCWRAACGRGAGSTSPAARSASATSSRTRWRWSTPSRRILREQLLRSAAHQFREGDVQHWWHPPSGRGVRTRISDDYLWLPYAACRYVAALGDTGVLDEKVQFLDGRPVKPRRGELLRPARPVRRVRDASTSTASARSRTACASASTACR